MTLDIEPKSNNRRKFTGNKRLKIKSNGMYWVDILNRYRASKSIRTIRRKFDIDFKYLQEHLEYSRQYIYGVQEMTIKPSKDFLDRLDLLLAWLKLLTK